MARLRLLYFASSALPLLSAGLPLNDEPCDTADGQSLPELMRAHGTDKTQHGYDKVYEVLLAPRRCDIRAVLEIGIGTLRPEVPSTMAPTAQAWDPNTRPYSTGDWAGYRP